MDILVKNARNLPQDAYISIRIGETRRQGPYRVGERFHFPDSQHATVKVDAFQNLGIIERLLLGYFWTRFRNRVLVCFFVTRRNYESSGLTVHRLSVYICSLPLSVCLHLPLALHLAANQTSQ